jgi:hypothetical protein
MKALLGIANFGLLPVPSTATRCGDHRLSLTPEASRQQFLNPHRKEMPDDVTTMDKHREQQRNRLDQPFCARSFDLRMLGTTVVLMVALFLIAGAVAVARADRWAPSATTIRFSD